MNEETAHQYLSDMRHGCWVQKELNGVDYRDELLAIERAKNRLELECGK